MVYYITIVTYRLFSLGRSARRATNTHVSAVGIMSVLRVTALQKRVILLIMQAPWEVCRLHSWAVNIKIALMFHKK
jgi:hypothetical protein